MSFCFKYNEKSDIEENYFLKKYHKDKYKDLDTDKIEFINKSSVQDDSLCFTNKFERATSNRITQIKTAINDLCSNPEMLNECFDGEEISYKTQKDILKMKRLDKILKLYDKFPTSDVVVYKYAPNNRYYNKYRFKEYERGFQLLFTHSNRTINVYLIDLYHLAIISKDQNMFEDYNRRKKYKKDIFECLFNELKDTSFVC